MLSDGWMVNGTVAFLAFRAERNEAKCLEVVARVQLSPDGFVELDDGLSVARVVHHGDGHRSSARQRPSSNMVDRIIQNVYKGKTFYLNDPEQWFIAYLKLLEKLSTP